MKFKTILITLITAAGISVYAAQNPVVLVKTSMGDIEIELFQDKAPLTVANFLKYAGSGFYNGTIFHRVIGNFMIQGGGITPDMKEKRHSRRLKMKQRTVYQIKEGLLLWRGGLICIVQLHSFL